MVMGSLRSPADVTRSSTFAHIIRNEDRTSTGHWGPFTLKSAFQPIFRFREGKLAITAFEALIRPFRDDMPVAPPLFFATLPGIDRLHVETLSRTLHLLNAAACLPGDAGIFVNFDPSMFVDRSIADGALRDMRLVLNEAGIDPRRVVCEVTEQKSASQDTLHTFVGTLRENGLGIAVDDYGAEDSDINRIRALRPDIVKFDAHWCTHLMDSGPGFGLLSAMVDIFSMQGIETVFEGIEENWQLELAEKTGAPMVQGYVLARPQIAPADFALFRSSDVPQPLAGKLEVELPHPAQTYGAGRPPKTFGRRVAH
jgi:EAL domain-containing protein (putative c-di-GMP-specific phosphodiesterase class I)